MFRRERIFVQVRAGQVIQKKLRHMKDGEEIAGFDRLTERATSSQGSCNLP